MRFSRVFLMSAISMLIAFHANAQQFQESYGTNPVPGSGIPNQEGYAIAATRDGGYIVVGRIAQLYGTDYKINVIKLLPTGTIQWERTIWEDGYWEARSVKEDASGNFIIVGNADQGSIDRGVILQLSPSGAPINWSRVGPNNTSSGLYSVDLIEIDPQNINYQYRYVATGYQNIGNTPKPIIVLSDGAGNNIIKTFDVPATPYLWGTGYSITQIKDANNYCTGFAVAGLYNNNLLAFRTDLNGIIQTSYRSTNNIFGAGYAIRHSIELGRDQFIVAGNTYNGQNGYIVKFDNIGVVSGSKVFGTPSTESISSLLVTPTAYYILGTSNGFSANKDAYLVKTDINCMIQDSRVFGGSRIDEGREIIKAFDGDLVFTGKTTSFRPVTVSGTTYWPDNTYVVKSTSSLNECGLAVTTQEYESDNIQSLALSNGNDLSWTEQNLANLSYDLFQVDGECCSMENLVKNPGFEDYNYCPYGTLTDPLLFSNTCKHWTNPTAASPDYFNKCVDDYTACGYSSGSQYFYKFDVSNATAPYSDNFIGRQTAKNGKAYAGIYLDDKNDIYNPCNSNGTVIEYREYIKSVLCKPLEEGVTYDVSFYISLAEESHIAVESPVIAGFTNSSVFFQNNTCKINPASLTGLMTETSSNGFVCTGVNSLSDWKLVTGTYTAQGGETAIILGCFGDPQTRFIDQTSCLTNGPDDCNYSQFAYSAYYYIDDVSVTPSLGSGRRRAENTEEQKRIPLGQNSNITFLHAQPNPAIGDIVVEYGIEENAQVKLGLYNLLGEEVASFKNEFMTKGNFSLNYSTQHLTSGIYHLRLQYNGITKVTPIMINK